MGMMKYKVSKYKTSKRAVFLLVKTFFIFLIYLSSLDLTLTIPVLIKAWSILQSRSHCHKASLSYFSLTDTGSQVYQFSLVKRALLSELIRAPGFRASGSNFVTVRSGRFARISANEQPVWKIAKWTWPTSLHQKSHPFSNHQGKEIVFQFHFTLKSSWKTFRGSVWWEKLILNGVWCLWSSVDLICNVVYELSHLKIWFF